jgi:hypothetical protein
MASFASLLGEWIGSEVTIINPESFKSSALGKGLTFQAYQAKFAELGDDFIRVVFQAKKGDAQTDVEQLIPFDQIKRVSRWGDEKLIHL